MYTVYLAKQTPEDPVSVLIGPVYYDLERDEAITRSLEMTAEVERENPNTKLFYTARLSLINGPGPLPYQATRSLVSYRHQEALDEINVLMTRIAQRLTIESQNDRPQWPDVGDLNYVKEQLYNINDFWFSSDSIEIEVQ